MGVFNFVTDRKEIFIPFTCEEKRPSVWTAESLAILKSNFILHSLCFFLLGCSLLSSHSLLSSLLPTQPQKQENGTFNIVA